MPTLTQDTLYGDREEYYGEITVPNSRLFAHARLANALVDEARTWVVDGTLKTASADAANVGRVSVATSITASDGMAEDTFGLRVDELYTSLQNKPRSPGGDLKVTLGIGQPFALAEVNQEVNGREWTFTERVGVVDGDMVRKDPGNPAEDAEVPVEATLPVGTFDSWLSQFDNNEEIEFGVEGDTLRIGHHTGDYFDSTAETWIEDIGEDVTSVYSSDYLKDVFSALNAANFESVTARWGDEYLIEFRGRIDGIEVAYQFAPRIKK